MNNEAPVPVDETQSGSPFTAIRFFDETHSRSIKDLQMSNP